LAVGKKEKRKRRREEDVKITNYKSQITNKLQCPKLQITNERRIGGQAREKDTLTVPKNQKPK
jgi:hypothetical protein